MISRFIVPFFSNDPLEEDLKDMRLPTSLKAEKDDFSYFDAARYRDSSLTYFGARSCRPEIIKTDSFCINYMEPNDMFKNYNARFDFLKNFQKPRKIPCKESMACFEKLYLLSNKLKMQEYSEIIDICKGDPRIYVDSPLIPIIGYLSAICIQDESEEIHFFGVIENYPFKNEDLPHYHHLMDELSVLCQESRRTPLLDLLMWDTYPLINAMKNHQRVFPRIMIDKENIKLRPKIISKASLSSNLLHELIDKCSQIKEGLPDLIPLGEGVSLIKETPGSLKKFDLKTKPRMKAKSVKKVKSNKSEGTKDQIMSLIYSKQWKEVISLCNELLLINHDPELYQHRAYALMQMGKVLDAINDISHAIDMKPTDNRRKMRAALWIMVGRYSLSLSDLLAVEKTNEIEQAIGVLNQRWSICQSSIALSGEICLDEN